MRFRKGWVELICAHVAIKLGVLLLIPYSRFSKDANSVFLVVWRIGGSLWDLDLAFEEEKTTGRRDRSLLSTLQPLAWFGWNTTPHFTPSRRCHMGNEILSHYIHTEPSQTVNQVLMSKFILLTCTHIQSNTQQKNHCSIPPSPSNFPSLPPPSLSSLAENQSPAVLDLSLFLNTLPFHRVYQDHHSTLFCSLANMYKGKKKPHNPQSLNVSTEHESK